MASRKKLEPEIIKEWLNKPKDKRTMNDLFIFYGYLQQNKPYLLSFKASGDKYQTLKSILRNYIVE